MQRTGLTIVALLAGAALGFFGRTFTESTGELFIGSSAEREAASRATAEGLRSELDEARLALGRAESERRQAESDRDAERQATTAAAAALASARDEIAKLQARVDELDVKREATIQSVMARVEKFRGKGLQSLIATGEIGTIASELRELGENGTRAILSLLASDDPEDQVLAAGILMHMDEPAAVGPLTALALSETAGEMPVAMATQALMRMNHPSAVPALEKVVRETKSEAAKVNSLYGLCRHEHEGGIQMTLDYLRDESSTDGMKSALINGFFLLDSPKIMPIMDEISGREGVMSVFPLGKALIDYYKKVGTPAAKERVQAIVGNAQANEAVRAHATEALAGW